MKICLNCETAFSDDTWNCPQCHFQPGCQDNVTLLAEDLNVHYPQEAFDRLEKIEDDYFWFRVRNRIILHMLKKYFPSLDTYMEMGCGTGFVLRAVEEAYPDAALVGSEIFAEGLRIAQGRVPDATFYQMNALAIPFVDEFDVIGTFDVLEHIAEDTTALRQMHKAIKPGGGLVISVPQHPWLWSEKDAYAGHQRRYTRQELVSKVQDAGFQVLYVSAFMMSLVPPMLLLKRRTQTTAYDPQKKFNVSSRTNRIAEAVFSVEASLVNAGVSLPVGTSVLVVARKPAS